MRSLAPMCVAIATGAQPQSTRLQQHAPSPNRRRYINKCPTPIGARPAAVAKPH